MRKHHMMDIESLDVRSTAIVLSIGIVEFDPVTFAISRTLHVTLDTAEQQQAGRTIGADTVRWWAQQSEAARYLLSTRGDRVMPCLAQVSSVLDDSGGVWGNGVDFDNIIVGSLYDSFNTPKPWSFSRNRCHRTMKNLTKPKDYVAPVRAGVHHNALDDALFQHAELKAICTALDLRL